MGPAVARRLIVGLDGPELSAREHAWLAGYQPAGVILFSRNCTSFEQLKGLCEVLRNTVPGLEIMADHEGGPVSQLARAVGRPPVAFGLGRLDDLSLTAAVHLETGRRLGAAGVTRVLAPVVDVLTEPRNPVIGARAFGESAPLVERHAVAAVMGLLESGLRVCLKHWPGHGGSLVDSHLGPGEVGTGGVVAPFVGGLAAGADAVMVAHLTASAESAQPATLDREFLAASHRSLRTPGGAAPRLIADDITMGALRQAMSEQGVAVLDTTNEGMIDPAQLPLAWLDALAAAGCEQLLVRGIPYGALPVPADGGRPQPAREAEPGPTPGFRPEAYAAARCRLWDLAGRDFAAPDADLLWWDHTAGDRWQVAGGDLGSAWERLLPVVARRFAGVRSWRTDAGVPGRTIRLLVTSHRPLPALDRPDERLATEGVCLAMGHPSLAGDLRRYLGPGWRVGAVYDVAPEDIFARP